MRLKLVHALVPETFELMHPSRYESQRSARNEIITSRPCFSRSMRPARSSIFRCFVTGKDSESVYPVHSGPKHRSTDSGSDLAGMDGLGLRTRTTMPKPTPLQPFRRLSLNYSKRMKHHAC